MKITSKIIYEMKYKGAEALLLEEALRDMIPPWTPKSRSTTNNKFRLVLNKLDHQCPSYYHRKTVRFSVDLTGGDLTLCRLALKNIIKKRPSGIHIEGYQKLATYFKFRGVK